MKLKSDKVYEEAQHYFCVKLKSGASEQEKADALAELTLFHADYYGAEHTSLKHEIETIVNKDGSVKYQFPTMYEMRGTDYNPQIYPDAVYASTLIKNYSEADETL